MAKAAVITGLAAEIDRFKSALPADNPAAGAFLSCAAANSQRAAALAEKYIAAGVKGLVSFGVCGGLDPALTPGQIILPKKVVSALGPVYKTDPAWQKALQAQAEAAELEIADGALYGSDAALATAAEKQAIAEAQVCQAVDMESHGVGRIAQAAGVPFVVVRAVADPAQRSVPAISLGLIGPDGRPSTSTAMFRLLGQPWQLPALVKLSRDYRTALTALELAALLLSDTLLNRPD